MTSTRKSLANKRNASLSTGPRTLGGKLRSSRNAFRHGLATSVVNHNTLGIDRLARALVANSNDYGRIQRAQVVAEAHFDLARIRGARAEVLAKICDFEGCSKEESLGAMRCLGRIDRYERRTRSKLRKSLRQFLETGSETPNPAIRRTNPTLGCETGRTNPTQNRLEGRMLRIDGRGRGSRRPSTGRALRQQAGFTK